MDLGALLLPWFALAAALQSQTDSETPAPADSAAITITPDNVELFGAGEFAFKFDPDAFDVDPPPGGKELSLTVRLWFDASGEKAVACDVGWPSLRQATQTACAQLMASATFRRMPGMVAALGRGFVDVDFGFYRNPRDHTAKIKTWALARPGYANATILYPPDDIPDADRLKPTDGQLKYSFKSDDYPPVAIRYGTESHSNVQLGISRNGRVKTCRPITSSGRGTAYIDNRTCALFLQRGRFEFAPGAPAYDGVRYFNKLIRWWLPEV